jgi:hypothetical protein
VDYLNGYVKQEQIEPINIEIPIKQNILHVGENTILIFSSSSVSTPAKGVDDFDFNNLGIVFR